MAKSLIAERRAKNAVCPRCKSPDYIMSQPYFKCGKPNFSCNSCGASWQYGKTGGIYKELSQ